MSHCVAPNCWNLKHQSQEQVHFEEEEDNETNRSSHISNPMSNHEVAELTWQNGQLAFHGLNRHLPTASSKPTWGISGDTLESIVHQATCLHTQNHNFSLLQHDQNQTPAVVSSIAASSGSSGRLPTAAVVKKRARSSSDVCGEIPRGGVGEEYASACASASDAFCKENDDSTMMTWASHLSPQTMKAKAVDEDYTYQDGLENQDEEQETRGETGRSQATRRSRASAIHNLSERQRRRHRIKQKMNTLQKLVPNASKTDKASMLDEVIEYLKQLQTQVEMMSMRNMAAQMMMQKTRRQLQMSALARMGVGMGIGILDDNNSLAPNPSPVTAPTHTFLPPPPPSFVTPPPMIPTRFAAAAQANSDASSHGSIPSPDPYCTLLAQSMNMELYNNKMAALYRPQINQTTQTSSNPSRSNNVAKD
ncbi:hypothetical protein ERO13_D03G095300v2 [Gossypium hirsutum]|uniref:Transcription factor PIF7 isoform X1 n=1 Tax=Gossypium hirsutum TaxID=3635 RepID=A0A1U8NM09_GOSHI|nr:transcription factor PIF7 isoform X1 [Gossypium hirsutum]KAG4155162.1 hypothetical protein ERO13_D03G095300v2 [Gossypium hirsutum]